MMVVERKPVPIYEVECEECKSKIQYRRADAPYSRITCPVCGLQIWACSIRPVRYEEGNDDGAD